jgi:hypothetical protein
MVDMKKLLLAGVAVLSVLGASAAHADEKWKADFRKCWIAKQYSKNDTDLYGLSSIGNGDFLVTIGPEEIPELEKALAILKKCNKFWQCVQDRDAGKVKHCYYNDRRWR